VDFTGLIDINMRAMRMEFNFLVNLNIILLIIYVVSDSVSFDAEKFCRSFGCRFLRN
jgi:hypothetical protein